MHETSKCQPIRAARLDFDRYLKGSGIDIGSGADPLKINQGSVMPWDQEQGDATHLASLSDERFDFVYSSHCLEHLADVKTALRNWVRVLRPGGILYLVVPDFGLYEKRMWPSRFNPDHKSSFSLSISRREAGSRKSHYPIFEEIVPILQKLRVTPIEVRLEDYGYDYGADPAADQTLKEATAQICLIGRKQGRLNSFGA